jgi:hypothetical protein
MSTASGDWPTFGSTAPGTCTPHGIMDPCFLCHPEPTIVKIYSNLYPAGTIVRQENGHLHLYLSPTK